MDSGPPLRYGAQDQGLHPYPWRRCRCLRRQSGEVWPVGRRPEKVIPPFPVFTRTSHMAGPLFPF